jgi:hypothetical protein
MSKQMRKRGRPKKHESRSKYLAEYMQGYRKRKADQDKAIEDQIQSALTKALKVQYGIKYGTSASSLNEDILAANTELGKLIDLKVHNEKDFEIIDALFNAHLNMMETAKIGTPQEKQGLRDLQKSVKESIRANQVLAFVLGGKFEKERQKKYGSSEEGEGTEKCPVNQQSKN